MNNSGVLSNKTIYLVIDELSGMHLKNERYFGIGGYLINDILINLLKIKKINLVEYQSFFPYENKQNLLKNLVFFEEDDKIIK